MSNSKTVYASTIAYILIQFIVAFFMTGCALAAGEEYIYRYLDGKQFQKNREWKEAVSAYTDAISGNDQEKAQVNYYGMRYGEYLPHREKGICLFHLKQYKEAILELETSYRQVKTRKAKTFLDQARKALGDVVDVPEELVKMKFAAEINKHGVGVVIGNKDYSNKDIEPVKYAIRDAAMIKKCLITSFGYEETNIIYKENATKGTLEYIFGSRSNPEGYLSDIIKPGLTDLFIYYSGHGTPDVATKTGYLLPSDGHPNKIAISGYSTSLLSDNLSRLPTRSTIIVMDACFSGKRTLKDSSPEGIIINKPFKNIHKNNTITITSSDGNQLSSWYKQKGHGLFTYYFLLGLAGEANTDKDKLITVTELSDYLNEKVPQMARALYQERIQTPTISFPDKNKVLLRFK